MRVSKLSIWVMCLAMVLNSLTLFSFASEKVALNNSGSTEISMKAMRSVAASEGVALTAAEGDSGQFGYNISPSSYSLNFIKSTSGNNFVLTSRNTFLPSGDYSLTADFTSSSNGFYIYQSGSQLFYYSLSTSSPIVNFSISDDGYYNVFFTFPSSSDYDSLSVLSYSLSELTPVEGISSGYTYSSGIIPRSTRSIFETLDCSFGNQPAGKYLINIYHWGDSYDVNFQISDSTDSYYLPVSTDGGVTTLVYNHPGGDFTLGGNFSVDNIETSVSDGYYATSGNSTRGDVDFYGSLSWVFNITDIVAIPYEQAADSNFGFFAPIIGFFNDHFSSMKAWIATQIDKIAGDDATQAEVDSASSALQKEVEEVNELSNNLSSQTSNLEQQFTTDFAVPDEVSGSTSSIQLIYTGLFSSLGIFSIFIWLPVVFAVIKKLLRL